MMNRVYWRGRSDPWSTKCGLTVNAKISLFNAILLNDIAKLSSPIAKKQLPTAKLFATNAKLTINLIVKTKIMHVKGECDYMF